MELNNQASGFSLTRRGSNIGAGGVGDDANNGGNGPDLGREQQTSFSDYTVHSIRVALTKPLLRLTRAIRYRGTKRPAYETSGLNRVTRCNVRHQLSIRENALFAAAESNDVELLESSVRYIQRREAKQRGRLRQDETDGTLPLPGRSRRASLKFEDRTDLGGTAYHIALQNNNMDVASRLLMIYPEYVNMTYTGPLNEGQHPLHIAVVNQNLKLVKELVAFGANVNEPRCTGQFFNPSSKHCQVYWGEHVLAFAVCLNQKETVEYLIGAGADINATDNRGNNIFHLLVLQHDQAASVDMFKHIVDSLGVGSHLEDEQNKNGMTPIQLAAKEANAGFFRELVHRRRHVHWTYGPITSCVYSLKGIDTHEEQSSVLELLALNDKPQSVELIRMSPIKDILDAKWRQFGYFYFIMWFLVYLTNIIILTVVVRTRPVYCPRNTSALIDYDENNVRSVQLNMTSFPAEDTCGLGELPDGVLLSNLSESCELTCFPKKKRRIFGTGEEQAYRTNADFARLAGEVLVIIGVMISLCYEAPDLRRRGYRKYFTNFGSGSFQALSWVYGFLIFISVILRLAENDDEEITLSFAVVLGWFFILFFARGFRFLGPYIAIIQEILRTDTLRFLMIFSVTIISFSGVTHATFNEARPKTPEGFFALGDIFIFLFRLAIGITEFDVQLYRSAPQPGWAIAFLITYVLLGFLLLIQLLIAMMNATHQRVEGVRGGVWEKQLASLILLLERRVPKRLRIRTGFPGKHYSLGSGPDDDRWFIRVVEHGVMKKITRAAEVPYSKKRRIAVRRKQEHKKTLRGERLKYSQTLSQSQLVDNAIDHGFVNLTAVPEAGPPEAVSAPEAASDVAQLV
eukprot:scpid28817/ scgid18272/ Transient receptor potential cation channel subfamily V member 6; CaT-like; Calcium transport protein 1; Epithelial calcium channel 2